MDEKVNSLTFIIDGPPVPKGRPRVTRRGTYTPAKSANYETAVGWIAKAEMRGTPPLTGPLKVKIEAELPIPKSWSKTKKEAAERQEIQPTSKPDADNLAKSVLDGLEGIAFEDDAQIVRLEVIKRYAITPKATVHLMPYQD